MRRIGCITLLVITIGCSYIVSDKIFVKDETQILSQLAVVGITDPLYKDPVRALLLKDVLFEGGSSKYSIQQTRDLLERSGASVTFNISLDGVYTLQIKALPSRFNQALEVVLDHLQNPAFDSTALELKKMHNCEALTRQIEKPVLVAIRGFRLLLFGEDEFVNFSCKDFASIKSDDLIKFYESLKFKNYKFVTNANLSASHLEGLRKVFRKGFTPSTIQFKRKKARQLLWIFSETPHTTVLLGNISDNSLSSTRYYLRAFEGLLSEDFDSRLFSRVRSELGLAYLVQGGWTADLYRGFVYVVAQTSPELVETLITESLREINLLTKVNLKEDLQKLAIREKRKLIFSYENQFMRRVQQVFRELVGLPLNEEENWVKFLHQTNPDLLAAKWQELLRFGVSDDLTLVLVGSKNPVDIFSDKGFLSSFELFKGEFNTTDGSLLITPLGS
jgi:predicted Zn-dependent peptidase